MIDVRRARAADLSRLLTLETAGFTRPWRLDTLEQALVHPLQHFYVGERSGEVIAYALFQLIAEEGELLRISVESASRGRGIGRMLLTDALARLAAHGMAQCYLEVAEGNIAARSLYEGIGFFSIGSRRAYYDGEDAILYQWKGGNDESNHFGD